MCYKLTLSSNSQRTHNARKEHDIFYAIYVLCQGMETVNHKPDSPTFFLCFCCCCFVPRPTSLMLVTTTTTTTLKTFMCVKESHCLNMFQNTLNVCEEGIQRDKDWLECQNLLKPGKKCLFVHLSEVKDSSISFLSGSYIAKQSFEFISKIFLA